jgi:hypothetical protein
MPKDKDHHAQGQHDREKSRNDGWPEIIISGGSSPSYNPPPNKEDREEYNAGWKNAKR